MHRATFFPWSISLFWEGRFRVSLFTCFHSEKNFQILLEKILSRAIRIEFRLVTIADKLFFM
jgi:hypothetical protein